MYGDYPHKELRNNPIKINITLQELCKHHGIEWPMFAIPPEIACNDPRCEDPESLTQFDMNKIDELFDQYMDDMIEKEHGEFWMTDEATAGPDIRLTAVIDKIVNVKQDFEKGGCYYDKDNPVKGIDEDGDDKDLELLTTDKDRAEA
tara:strand:+ start:173 stop:613 length:441 start_codon:yes stop_codon:yes gene_type:complete